MCGVLRQRLPTRTIVPTTHSKHAETSLASEMGGMGGSSRNSCANVSIESLVGGEHPQLKELLDVRYGQFNACQFPRLWSHHQRCRASVIVIDNRSSSYTGGPNPFDATM